MATHFLIESYEQANFNKRRTIRDCLRSVRLGKTIFLFQMLLITTFYPKFDSIYYFYEYEKTKLSSLEGNVNLFSQSSLDLISPHSWKTVCSFVNTCDAIFNGKKCLRVATAGQNRKVSVVYVKHNLYQQLIWTQRISISSNLRHPVSPICFGKQLNNTNSKESYILATKSPFGHLVIDFDPKTSDSMR